jgi:hypothetical protein
LSPKSSITRTSGRLRRAAEIRTRGMVRRMSPYERRRRDNARRSGGTHRSRAGNTTPGQRDSGHLVVPSDLRTLSRNTSRCEAGTNLQANRSRGAHASQRLNLSRHREGLRAISQGQNRTRESRPSGIAGGSWEPWQMAELGTHSADRKGGHRHSSPSCARAQILPNTQRKKVSGRRQTGSWRKRARGFTPFQGVRDWVS